MRLLFDASAAQSPKTAEAATTSPAPTTARQDRLPGKALLGLFLAGFISILTECLPAGLLPEMSRTLDTSVSLTGQTVTIYALATALGAIPLAGATATWPRKHVLVLRFTAGLGTGLIWPLLGGYAARLAPQGRLPKFQGHAGARNWVGAADEPHFIPDVGTIGIRNKLDRAHFLLARAVEDQGLPLEQIALDVSDVFGVQGALLALGFKPLSQDGVDGPLTQGKAKEFQSANGLAENGAFNDPDTVSALAAQLSGLGFTVLGA